MDSAGQLKLNFPLAIDTFLPIGYPLDGNWYMLVSSHSSECEGITYLSFMIIPTFLSVRWVKDKFLFDVLRKPFSLDVKKEAPACSET